MSCPLRVERELTMARQEQPCSKEPSDDRKPAKPVEQRGDVEIVREIRDADVREAALAKQHLVTRGVANTHVPFDLRQDPARLQPLHEVLSVRRMHVERRSRLERSAN